MMPVRLPLGRRKSVSANPSATGFPNAPTTIGIVDVACLAASAVALAAAKITSGVVIVVAKAILDDQILSFDIPEIAKSGPDRVNVGSGGTGRGQTENPNP